MKQSRLFFAVLWLIILAVLPNAALSETITEYFSETNNQTETELEKVSLQLQWKHHFEFAGFYAALEKGYYREAGLDVEIREYEKGIDTIGSVLSGEASFGTNYSTVILARMEGKPIVLMANYFKRSPLAIVTKPDIYFPGDLKGKRVMGEKQTFDTANFAMMFRQFEMSSDDFTMVPHTFNTDKFINNEVDAMTIFLTAETYYLREAKVPYNVIDPNNYGVPLYDVNLFTSESFAKTKPLVVKSFTDASTRGWEYALAHPEEIVDLIIHKYNTVDASKAALLYEAEQTQRMVQPDLYPIGSIDPNRIRRIEEQFISEGVAANFVDPEDFVFGLKRKSSINLTQEEKAYIKANPVIRVANEMDWPPFDYVEIGEPSGYSIEHIRLLADKVGLRIEFVNGYSWAELVELFKQKKIDAMPVFYFNEERDAYTLYTSSYAKSSLNLYSTVENKTLNSIADLKGKRIGIEKGDGQVPYVKSEFPDTELIEFESIRKMMLALTTNKLDGIIQNPFLFHYYVNEHQLFNLRLVDFLRLNKEKVNPSLHIGVRKDLPVLHQILQKTMMSLRDEEKISLNKRWLGSSAFSDQRGTKSLAKIAGIELSQSEQEYLSRLDEITYCVDPDWMPFERLNEQGQHGGMTADLMKELERRLGISLRLVRTDSWSESLLSARAGQCKLISAAAATAPRMEYLDFSNPHGEYPLVVAVRGEELFVENLDAIQDKTLGVVAGYAHTDLIREKYPNFNIVEVKNVVDGLKKVKDEKLYGFVDTIPSIGYSLRRQGIEHLKIGGKLEIPLKLAFGIHKGEPPELISILNKFLDSFSEEEKQLLAEKWFSIKIEKVFDYTRLWLIVSVILAIVLFLFWNNNKLKRMVDNKTHELTDLNASLEDRVVERTDELLQAKKTLEKKEKQQRDGIASASHELRTPLATMMAKVSAMQDGIRPLDQEQMSSLARSVDHLSSLVKDLYVLSLADIDALMDSKEYVELNGVVADSITAKQVQLVDHQLRLETRIDSDVIVFGDAHRLRQIIDNLLENCARYTTSGGTVFVTVTKSGSHAELIVSDTGPDVDDEALSMLFDRFYRVDKSRSRQKGGAGLGLSLVKAFAESHGGQVKAFHASQGGLGISVKIPLAENTDN